LADSALKRKSVTANDNQQYRQSPILQFLLNPQANAGGCPIWWSPARDHWLRGSIYLESLWASAVATSVRQLTALQWDVTGDAPRISAYAHEIILDYTMHEMSKQVQDYILTDNGQFTEVVRASSAAGSRILGLMHLDSLRCTRTGDEDIPVIYRDLKGIEHELQAHQVFFISDMPSAGESWRGVGHCAASRAYTSILKMAAIETYILDKVSGRRPLSLELIRGISDKTLETAMDSAREGRERDSKFGQAYSYMGAIVMPVYGDKDLSNISIPFAALPDGFDREKEFEIGVIQYADALGINPEDIKPNSTKSLGVGAQSVVLEQKSSGRLQTEWKQAMTHSFNEWVLPDRVTFAFSERDLRDLKQQADVDKLITEMVATQITAGIITASQAAQILADADIIPTEFVPEDTTLSTTIADDQKPEAERALQDAQSVTEPQPVTPAVVPVVPTAKELRSQFANAMARFNAAMVSQKESSNDVDNKILIDLLREMIREKQTGGITLTADSVTLPKQEPPVVNITMPEQKPPQVNVTFDTRELSKAMKEVARQAPPTITVNVPPQPVPQVTVNVPPQPAPLVLSATRSETRVKRDAAENIVALETITEVEPQ
jgi:hypothetical protein